MRLTRQSEIAIGILLACARNHNGMTLTLDAAQQAGTTKDFAARIVALLVRAGLLNGHRGRYGGLSLVAPPDAIRLGDVLRITQPDFATVETQLSGAVRNRAFDSILRAATTSFLDTMDDFSLGDLQRGALPCLDFALTDNSRAVRFNAGRPAFRSRARPTGDLVRL